MVLKDVNAGIFSITIEVGEHFGLNKEDLNIVLREPTTQETIELSKKSNVGDEEDLAIDQNKIFEIMPNLIIKHNFQKEMPSKPGQEPRLVDMTSKEVWALIMARSMCSTAVVTEWSENIPLAQKKLEK